MPSNASGNARPGGGVGDVRAPHPAGFSAQASARAQPPGPRLEPEAFFDLVERVVGSRTRRGVLAYIEVFGPHHEQAANAYLDLPSSKDVFDDISAQIEDRLGPQDGFCWFGGRFILLIERPNGVARLLGQISRTIATGERGPPGGAVHLTPVVAYLNVRRATGVHQLWELAEQTLDRAKSSLEIEPVSYVRNRQARVSPARPRRRPTLPGLNSPGLVLLLQFVISLLIGLGGPFILYATADALGSDISGGVYVGVVIVLVVTATTIWIEGFLALKATTPPLEPGSPYPAATLIIPAYLPNEADTIMETLNAFLELRYDNLVQIIVAYNSPTARLPVEDELDALAAEQAEGGRFVIEPVRVRGSTSKAQNVNAVVGRVTTPTPTASSGRGAGCPTGGTSSRVAARSETAPIRGSRGWWRSSLSRSTPSAIRAARGSTASASSAAATASGERRCSTRRACAARC